MAAVRVQADLEAPVLEVGIPGCMWVINGYARGIRRVPVLEVCMYTNTSGIWMNMYGSGCTRGEHVGRILGTML